MSSNTAGRITAIIAHQGDVPINRLNSVTESLMQVFDERIAELEAHNQQLLADKEASPAIIAGYRERGEQLLARVAELESKIAEMDAVFDAVLETHRSDTARMSKRIIELEQRITELAQEKRMLIAENERLKWIKK